MAFRRYCGLSWSFSRLSSIALYRHRQSRRRRRRRRHCPSRPLRPNCTTDRHRRRRCRCRWSCSTWPLLASRPPLFVDREVATSSLISNESWISLQFCL